MYGKIQESGLPEVVTLLCTSASVMAQLVKNLQCGGPGLGRSPGEGKGYPLQYSGLENSMDCIIHGVAKSGHN